MIFLATSGGAGKPRSKAKPRQTRYAPGLFFAPRTAGGTLGTRHYGRQTGAQRWACQSNFCHYTLRSLRSCRACSQSHLMFFAPHPHLGSGIETMAGTNLIRLRLLFKSTGSIVVCNVPAIVIHGSFFSEGQLWRKREGV
jgi:hypothetical protein